MHWGYLDASINCSERSGMETWAKPGYKLFIDLFSAQSKVDESFLEIPFRFTTQKLLEIEIVHQAITKIPTKFRDDDKEIIGFGQQMKSEWSETIEKEISHRLTTEARKQLVFLDHRLRGF